MVYNLFKVLYKNGLGYNLASFSLLSVFFSFFIDFFFFYSRCPTFPFTFHPPFFRVVAAPHGTLTATLWANVGSHFSLNGSEKSATFVILLDRVPALWRMGIGFVYVPSRYIPLAGTHFCSTHICRRLIISVLLVPFG